MCVKHLLWLYLFKSDLFKLIYFALPPNSPNVLLFLTGLCWEDGDFLTVSQTTTRPQEALVPVQCTLFKNSYDAAMPISLLGITNYFKIDICFKWHATKRLYVSVYAARMSTAVILYIW